MIQLVTRQNENGERVHGPRLICDVCHRPIENIWLAMYKWKGDAGDVLPHHEPIVLLHKGDCDTHHNQAHNASAWLWGEATELFGLMLNGANTYAPVPHEIDMWPFLIGAYS